MNKIVSAFSNVIPDAVARNYCGACQQEGRLHKYADVKSLDRSCAPLYICTACTAIYNASGEFDRQDVKAIQQEWAEDPEFYKVPERDEFNQIIELCNGTFRFFQDELGVTFSGTYVEVGAGNGLRAASALNFFDRVFAFDHVRSRLEATKRIVDTDRYQLTDDQHIYGINADAILIWHAMEHLLSPGEVFDLCGRIMNSGGYLLVQVPILSAEHVYPGHYYFYNELAFTRMANHSGLKPVKFYFDLNINAITGVFCK